MQHIRRKRVLVLAFVIMIALSNLQVGKAVTYGLVNPSFGLTSTTCSLNGWTTSGAVSTALTSSITGFMNNCVAQLTATNDGAGRNFPATLEQGFYLSPDAPSIKFYYASGRVTLTFRLYNSAGGLVHQESFAVESGGHNFNMAERSFPNYAGQYVKVSVQATVLNPAVGSPTTQKLNIDFQAPEGRKDSPSPETPPGGAGGS